MREADLQIPVDLLPRIGGMATMPSRRETLMPALASILPQVSRLYLYLDKYSEIPPEFAALPKVVCLLSSAQSLGSGGKFEALRRHRQPCLFFGFDDDIFYPPGYVANLSAALVRYRFRALVGIHAAIYDIPMASYAKSRRVLHFRKPQEFDVMVDELGTGTIAFHSCALDFDANDWIEPNQADLHLMIEAVRQEIPRISLRRPALMLRPLAEDQEDSLFRRSLIDDSAQTQLLQAAMAHYPGRWSASS